MSPESVAFLVVVLAVAVIPGGASLAAWRASRRAEARLVEVLAVLRGRQGRRPVGFELPAPRPPEKTS